jgi:hypothetical protein
MRKPMQANHAPEDLRRLKAEIYEQPLFDKWLSRAESLLRSGSTAGTDYPEVWIRDLATFIDLALDSSDAEALRADLEGFFHFQGEDGSIVDGYLPKDAQGGPYDFIFSPSRPQLKAHKNTVEADQETSLVQAVRIYVEKRGDGAFLQKEIAGRPVLERLEAALGWLMRERWSEAHGLVWNGTTIDWGDLQVEDPNGRCLNEASHPALGIYTNAMFLTALRDLSELCAIAGRDASRLEKLADQTADRIRRHLWDTDRKKFIPHVYLNGSPFPEDFDEASIYYHGGTACAIQADLLENAEILDAFHTMKANQQAAGARTIGITVWPPYQVPEAPHRLFRKPFHYQNAGDWPWFGGRMVLGLIRHGFHGEAYEALLPMLEMTDAGDDFNEWYFPDGTPGGAFEFRGAAGVLGLAMKRWRAWAETDGDCG